MVSQTGPKRFCRLQKSLPVYTKRLLCKFALGKQRSQKLPHGQKLQQVSCEIVGISCSGRLPAATRPAPDHEMTPPSRPSPWSEIASKPMVPRGTSLKKSKKRRAIASVAPGPPLWPPPTRPSLGHPAQPPGTQNIYTNSRSIAQRPLCEYQHIL